MKRDYVASAAGKDAVFFEKWKIKGVRRFSAHWGQKKYKKNSFVKSFLLHKKVYYG